MSGQPPPPTSTGATNSHMDASDMLAEALKQMDGLLADTTKPGSQPVQNGHPHRLQNGGSSSYVASSPLMNMSPKLQTSRVIWLFNDLYTALKGIDDLSAIFQQLQPETQNYFLKWIAEASQNKDQLTIRSNPNPHKLDLMAENSSLKVRVARLEKELQDAEEKHNSAQFQINELQSLLNDRTIEVTELRSRLARSAPSSPDRSLSNSFKDRTLERERTLDRLKRKHYEVEKLKQAVESLMATNEEKNSRIEELRSALKRYKQMEEVIVKMQGPKVLEQIGHEVDNLSDKGSIRNSNGSCNENTQNIDTRLQVDVLDSHENRLHISGMPHPTATSTPVNNHGMMILPHISSHNPSHAVGSPLSSIHPSNSPSPLKTDTRSNSYDDIIGAPSKTPPTVKRQANVYAKTEVGEETLKDEMAQQYKALQGQTHVEPLKKKSSTSKGLKKLFGKIKRSNSQSLDDKLEDFKRCALRSTAGPRLGWSKELNDLDLPFSRWDTDRVALWLHVLGLSMYVGDCKRWVKNGEQLLQATSHDLEKELGIRNHFHRKKLQLALQAISSEMRSPVSELDHAWVTRWLDDIGLPQYKDQFTEARIDGRMLNYLTVDDLVTLKVTNQLHHLSLRRGIQVLRLNNFSPSCLKRRPAPDEGVVQNCPNEVILWTNHRVMEWLRNIDLSEYAPNLRGSGVHGALMVLEPRFGAELFATILSIPANKTLLRRHLSTHFVALIGNSIQQQKREFEAQAGYTPLTPSLRVKVKKSIFRNLKSDDREDFVCPVDPRADRDLCLNGGGTLPRPSPVVIPREEDEHLLARDHRYLDNVPTSDV